MPFTASSIRLKRQDFSNEAARAVHARDRIIQIHTKNISKGASTSTCMLTRKVITKEFVSSSATGITTSSL